MITFAAICKAALTGVEATDATYELSSLAHDLDKLRASLVEDARAMSARFARYADETESGEHVHTPPTTYSTLRDMDRDAATFAAKLDAFKAFFRIVTGKGVAAVRDAFASEST